MDGKETGKLQGSTDRMGGASITADTLSKPSGRAALMVLALLMLMASLGTSIANVALPKLAQVFDASFQQVQWVVLAYLLSITSLIVSVGRLGDIFGRRRLLLCGILVFTLASVLAGIATAFWLLVSARALQGLGAAVMIALALAFVSEAVVKEKTGSAMGMLGTMSAIGTALGPTLGGVLIAALSWRYIFLINIPLGLIALIFARRWLPDNGTTPAAQKTGFDGLGTLTLASALAAYALAITLGHGSFGRTNLLLLGIAVVATFAFVWAERQAAAPLIHLNMLHDARLRHGLIMSMVVSTIIMATLVVGPFYLAGALRLDTKTVGLVMSAGPLVSALTGIPAGRLVDRFGAMRTTFAGLMGLITGSLMLAFMPLSFGIPGYVIPLVFITAHYALFQAANNSAVMMTATANRRGVISGMLNLSRNLGLITGAAVMGAVFSIGAGGGEVATASADAVSAGLRLTFILAAGLICIALAIGLGAATKAKETAHSEGQA